MLSLKKLKRFFEVRQRKNGEELSGESYSYIFVDDFGWKASDFECKKKRKDDLFIFLQNLPDKKKRGSIGEARTIEKVLDTMIEVGRIIIKTKLLEDKT